MPADPGEPTRNRLRAVKTLIPLFDGTGTMESFGEYLKNLREEKGVSLEEIAEKTKIALTNLELLESDRYELLPPRVFVKGFIKSYVQELGLEADEVIEKFEEFSKEGELPDYGQEEHPLFHQKPPAGSFIGSTLFTAVLTAAGMLALGILLVTAVSRLPGLYGGGEENAPVVRPAGPEISEEAVEPSSSPVTGESTFTDAPPTLAGKKVLEIRAVDRTWLRIRSDSDPPRELTMSKGDTETFTAKKEFHIQTGNAGGIRVRFHGKEIPVLGDRNQTLSLTLPRKDSAPR